MPYVIKNSYGDFSRGGNDPDFVPFEKAKVWRTLGQVKNHLAMFRTYQGYNQVPQDWQVIEVALTQVGQPQNARELVQPNCDEQKRRQGEYRDAYAKEQADREKRELKRLKEKYE